MTTTLETLNETVAAYTSETRAIGLGGFCEYETRNGRNCAVGRCMVHPGIAASGSCRGLNKITSGGLDTLLKPEYQGFPIEFWIDLQMLHDNGGNWDPSGLSPIGQIRVREMLEEYA